VKLCDPGLALIKSFEKCVLTAYQDGGGVWTIGWGHTGPEVVAGLVWTQEQADTQLPHDLSHAVQAVNSSLTPWAAAHVTQNEFDALVAFTFNVGVGAEAHSTLLKCIGAGNFGQAADEFLKWDHVNGQVSAGLLRRRQAERDLFLRT